MNELLQNAAYFGIFLSIGCYLAGIWLKKRFKLALFNPLLVAVLLCMALLFAFDIDYETFNQGAQHLTYLLTPATVCLAIPLYEQISLLKKHAAAVLVGVASGVISCLGSILLLSFLFSLSHQQYVTLLPKSITTAIGMGVSDELGGMVTITVAAIILTGILGNIIAERVLKLFHIEEKVARGLAIGTAAHAIGTTKAMEMGRIEGAMSSLSIAVAGLMTVLAATLFACLY
jgi:predicted murein hydrolase (TIGR00659 family)